MIQMTHDELLISVDRESNDQVQVGDKTIFLDTSYNRNLHVRIFGVVESTPRAIRIFDEDGHYHGTREYSLNEPQIGEKVYFHFHTVAPHNKIILDDSKVVYNCRFRQIFCVIRDGKPVMMNNRVLVQPILQPWETCFTAGTKLTLKEGISSAKTLDDFEIEGGLQLKTTPAPIKHAGLVRHCADYPDLKPNDSIIFSKDSEFENEIENELYFVMYKKDIMAEFNPLELDIKKFRLVV